MNLREAKDQLYMILLNTLRNGQVSIKFVQALEWNPRLDTGIRQVPFECTIELIDGNEID